MAAQVDALRGSQADVSAALVTLAANVAAEEARLVDAQRAAQQAAAAADAARLAAEAAAAELAAMEEQVRGLAVQAYMTTGVDDEAAETFLESDDLTMAMQRRELLRHRHGSHSDTVDRLRAAREDSDIARAEADAAAERANEHEAAVEEQLASVQAARDQQQAVLNDVEARLDASLSEAAGLAALDAVLSPGDRPAGGRAGRPGPPPPRPRPLEPPQRLGTVAVAAEEATPAVAVAVAAQAVVAAAVAEQRWRWQRWQRGRWRVGSGEQPLPRRQRQPRHRARYHGQRPDRLVARGAAGCGVGPGPQLLRRWLPQPRGPVGVAPGALSRPRELAAVGLYTADRPARQLDARLGLAVDFTYQGGLISSRSNPGFAMAGGACQRAYGFSNLPSEPWHWSVNGN